MQRTVVIVEDDIDGTEGASTVQFSLDGISYEIDLNDKNSKALHDALTPFIEKARKAGSTKKSGSRKRGDGKAAEIREWARNQGHEVPERGRIPRELREAYEAA